MDEEDEKLIQNSLSGLYPLGCILSHDCLANTVHTFESAEVPIISIKITLRSIFIIFNLTKIDYIIIKKHAGQEGFRMTMRAGRDIKKGAEITNSYVDPQVDSMAREG